MSEQPLYRLLASLVEARANCAQSCNHVWMAKHTERLYRLVRDFMPSGAGFDAGTSIDLTASKPDKLVFRTSYHHMTDGFYEGWTEHKVIVRASLSSGFTLQITGRDRNDTKDYIGDVFHEALSASVVNAPSDAPPPSGKPVDLPPPAGES